MILRLLGLENHPPIELVSPHSKQECIKRLKVSVGSGWVTLDRHTVVGSIRHSSFRLRKRNRKRNSMQPILVCNIHQQSGNTQLACQFRKDLLVKAVLISWFAGIIYFVISSSIVTVSSLSTDGISVSKGYLLLDLVFLAVPILMALIVLLWIRSSLSLARNEPQFLIDFLREQLDATEVEAS